VLYDCLARARREVNPAHFNISQFSLQEHFQPRPASLSVGLTFLEALSQPQRELIYDNGDSAVLVYLSQHVVVPANGLVQNGVIYRAGIQPVASLGRAGGQFSQRTQLFLYCALALMTECPLRLTAISRYICRRALRRLLIRNGEFDQRQ
jgi:hypothetical protein